MVTVSVMPAERTGYTRIEVTDNGPGIEEEKLQSLKEAIEQGRSHPSAKGTGVGIVNVSKRLALYYESNSAGLDISSTVRQGTTVAFEIPNEHGGRTV
ncbi:osmolarity sensor protein [compost metagenome]